VARGCRRTIDVNSLYQLRPGPESIPAVTGYYLSDLGEARGRQDLYTKQSPQRLEKLREHALVESAVSSNRIEGVEVDRKRVGTVVFGKPLLRDRNEEELAGYRNALDLVHARGRELAVSEDVIKRLHRLSRCETGDAGEYKARDGDIIERLPSGETRVRFATLGAAQTPGAMAELVALWPQCVSERWVHPLIALAAFNLDFLCIHPFRDGNGRVSRLLLLLQCYHLGYEVGRYISLERLMEQNKERYYETLELSSQGWHERRHEVWHYVNFVLYVLKSAYKELEERLGSEKDAKGAKTAVVRSAIDRSATEFSVADLARECPGVSVDMIRRVLKDLRASSRVECLGRGQSAKWRRLPDRIG
jgi:Fic family protein